MWWVFAVSQLYRSSVLFETIRHETQLSTDYKLSLFDLQTSSYQALQRVLVSLGEFSSPFFFLECEPHFSSLTITPCFYLLAVTHLMSE